MMALTAVLMFTSAQLASPPSGVAPGAGLGWYVSGNPKGYEVTPLSTGACGTPAFLVRSQDEHPVGPAVVMQTFDALKYQGTRVRFTMRADARQVTDRAGLFVRVNDGARVVALDDMRGRWLRGDVSCRTVAIVLDVPKKLPAARDGRGPLLSVGFALYGNGAVEFGDSQFEKVGTDVALTKRDLPFDAGIGEVVLNADEVRLAGATLAERQADGVWLDGRRAVSVQGDAITQEGKGGGTLKLTATRERLAFEGTWSFMEVKKPMLVVLTNDELTLKWGDQTRALAAYEDTETCTIYVATTSLTGRVTDRVSVCGEVLRDASLRVPFLFAAFAEGFDPRRGDPVNDWHSRGMGPSKPTKPPTTFKPPTNGPASLKP